MIGKKVYTIIIHTQMQLTRQQLDVLNRIETFIKSDTPVFILRGYAGTGKTTMIKAIIDLVSPNRTLALMAPTGRAARILGKKTGEHASTIHKAIYDRAHLVSKEVQDIAETEFKLVFPVIQDTQDKQVVAIVDEASMLSSRTSTHEMFRFGTDNLMDDLLTFVRPSFGGKVIFVGDPAQLPPVGDSESNALRRDFFVERGLQAEEAELTEVLRQDDNSLILKNAMMIRDLLQNDKRNRLAFEDRKGDVESVNPDALLDKYLEQANGNSKLSNVLICYSNKDAAKYNSIIRTRLYGGNAQLRENESLLIVQNNYMLGHMNGDIVKVLAVRGRTHQSAPVYVQQGAEKVRKLITMNFLQVDIADANGNPITCMLLEDLLENDKPALGIDENRALYINFCMRHSSLKPGSKDFADELLQDAYYNAIRAKYGYAITGHKCQGGEWDNVFVDYHGRTGLSDDCLRWAYTATTRSSQTLFYTRLPQITPFSKFRIDPIQKCKNIDAEFRVLEETGETPFHTLEATNLLRAKYHCIEENLNGTPFHIHNVASKQYHEEYTIQTPAGMDRFQIHYNAAGIFNQAKALASNEYTEQVLLLLNDERLIRTKCEYKPSNENYEQLYSLICSACDTLSIQIMNVTEHPADFSFNFYLRTSGTYSYIKLYINAKGFVTYAKPMSLIGNEDHELAALINVINNLFV